MGVWSCRLLCAYILQVFRLELTRGFAMENNSACPALRFILPIHCRNGAQHAVRTETRHGCLPHTLSRDRWHRHVPVDTLRDVGTGSSSCRGGVSGESVSVAASVAAFRTGGTAC